jgi:hypothetical protein
VIVASPWARRCTIARRVGSPSAWNKRSSPSSRREGVLVAGSIGP